MAVAREKEKERARARAKAEVAGEVAVVEVLVHLAVAADEVAAEDSVVVGEGARCRRSTANSDFMSD